MPNDIHNDSHIESLVTYKIPIEIDLDRDLREKTNFIYEISREYLLATMDARKNHWADECVRVLCKRRSHS